MKARILPIPAFVFVLALAGAAAHADELIRFKSGYEMMVVSHREEKGMVMVTLEGGGEVGFPKDLIENLEGGKESARTTPSPLWNKVPSRVHVQKFLAPRKAEMPSRFLARGVSNAEGVTIGYSKAGDRAAAVQRRTHRGGHAGGKDRERHPGPVLPFRSQQDGPGRGPRPQEGEDPEPRGRHPQGRRRRIAVPAAPHTTSLVRMPRRVSRGCSGICAAAPQAD